MAGFWRVRDDGIDIHVRLTPRASKDAIEGIEEKMDGRAHLNARVRAVPEKSAANAALEKLVASLMGVPASSVSVVSGATSRLKTVRIAGEARELAAQLKKLVDTGKAGD
ncbi:DUF167 family protein [Mesorhizobium sp. WSM2239]|uniref:UPF0235 protein ABVK49_05305 n=2 Tax=unclassified Mesorhizobium TaxID=325217 RepID=A0AAU8DA10_9HYPH